MDPICTLTVSSHPSTSRIRAFFFPFALDSYSFTFPLADTAHTLSIPSSAWPERSTAFSVISATTFSQSPPEFEAASNSVSPVYCPSVPLSMILTQPVTHNAVMTPASINKSFLFIVHLLGSGCVPAGSVHASRKQDTKRELLSNVRGLPIKSFNSSRQFIWIGDAFCG